MGRFLLENEWGQVLLYNILNPIILHHGQTTQNREKSGVACHSSTTAADKNNGG